MKVLRFILKVFKSYQYSDWLISGICFFVILLMIMKMVFFPYGMFHFGEADIYTEGLVSKNGIQNINPLFIDYNEADREVSRLVFSGLMKYDPGKRAIVDDMATLTINEDKTVYTFTLRQGIKWHDGEPVTIDDVYFTFHDIIQSDAFQNEILKTNFAGIDIKKIDPDKIEFTLDKPNTFFTANFTVGILPEHLLKNVDPYDLLKDDFNKMPIGTGPYRMYESVESFADGRMQVILEKNPYYYGDVSEIGYMRFIVFKSMEDLLADSTSVNGVVKITGNYADDLKEKSERFKFTPYELPQYTAVFMNMESAILKNKSVRMALQKSVDKSAIMKFLTNKVVVDMPIMELQQKEWGYKYDLDSAKGALYDAGYKYGLDDKEHLGIRYDSEGTALQLNFIAILYDEGTEQFEEMKKIVSFLTKSWEMAGIGVNVEFLSQDVFKEKLMKREYDMALVGHNLGYNFDTYSYWHSTQADPKGQNFSNYKSFQVDTLIEDLRSMFDQEKRLEKLDQLAKIIADDVPAIFLYRPVYYYASDGKVSGVDMEGVVFPSDRFFGVAKWKFE